MRFRLVLLVVSVCLGCASVAAAQQGPGIAPADDREMDKLVQDAMENATPGAGQAGSVEAGSFGVPGDSTSAQSQRAGPSMASLDMEAVNSATYHEDLASIRGSSPLILKMQVLLDRANASPGVIDSYFGDNVAKAIAVVESVAGFPVDGRLDPDVWNALGGDQAPPVLVPYEVTSEDAAGPFVEAIPGDFAEQAQMASLAYTSPAEMFSERFHMDLDLLKALNPNADFGAPGTEIIVADPDGRPIDLKVVRIEADKRNAQLRAFDEANRLIAAYPATIGSADNPSPSGTHEVQAVAPEPVYYYNPEKNFQQGDNTEKLELPPGPNNPVGSVWIDLTEDGYGIHGTPEPSAIDKTASHGCIRLTNWDAEELSELVEKGTTVEFLE